MKTIINLIKYFAHFHQKWDINYEKIIFDVFFLPEFNKYFHDKKNKNRKQYILERKMQLVEGAAKVSQKNDKKMKKQIGKAYGKYAKGFTPKPAYFSNCVKAFVVGGAVCTAALWFQNYLTGLGLSEQNAGAYVTVSLVVVAQLLTGLGVFDVIAKFAGAGIIVPITGFSNSMVSPALEYKREGLVLGVGAKLFSVAGPVLVCGIGSATVTGILYWLFNL